MIVKSQGICKLLANLFIYKRSLNIRKFKNIKIKHLIIIKKDYHNKYILFLKKEDLVKI